MINFDAVDFSEHRSEEVMFVLMLSVCVRVLCLWFVPSPEQQQCVDGNLKSLNSKTDKFQFQSF